MPRRCRSRSVIGLAFLAVALLPALGRAQTAPTETGDDLLQPSLEGNPNTPPTFAPPGSSSPTNQAPLPGRFTRGPIPSAPPVYGSPTGFGAGDTGFDSSNSRKRLAQTPNSGSTIAPSTSTFDQVPAQPPQVTSRPPVLPPPPPAVIYPSRAASRPGATLPPPPDELPISNPPPEVHPLSAANRPGAVLAIPAPIDYTASTPPPGLPLPGTLPLGTLPTRTLPFAGVDPYEALGIKAGNFLILPAIELSTGYSNNAARVPGGPGSLYYVVAPELHVRSDWASNSLTADIVSSYTAYGSDAFTPSLNAPFLNAKVDSQLDVTRYTQILLEGRTIISTYAPGSPNIQAGLAKLPATTTVGGTFGVAEAFGRLGVTLKGTFDRSTYATAQFADGETQNQDYLDFDQYAGVLRVAYEIDPGIKPFVEVSEDTRIHDQQFDI
ncbi:MAG TPA: outer membrane beta-barrel protein, partial [Xanthobacteraceae bacterium]